MLLSDFSAPAYPVVAHPKLQTARAESGCSENSVFRTHQISHLTSDQSTVAKRMFTDHQLIPQPHILVALNRNNLKIANFIRTPGNADRLGHCLVRPPNSRFRRLSGTGCRQKQITCGLQFTQRLQTTGSLRISTIIQKTKTLAQLIGDRSA